MVAPDILHDGLLGRRTRQSLRFINLAITSESQICDQAEGTERSQSVGKCSTYTFSLIPVPIIAPAVLKLIKLN